MKKISVILLAAILGVSTLAACSGNQSSVAESTSSDTAESGAQTTETDAGNTEGAGEVAEMSYQLGDAVEDFTVPKLNSPVSGLTWPPPMVLA